MFKLSLAVLDGIVLCAGAVQPAAAATKALYVGTYNPAKADFTTIQEAVSGVPQGSTINVCPGVYPEQVTITQRLPSQGVQSGAQVAKQYLAERSQMRSSGSTQTDTKRDLS